MDSGYMEILTNDTIEITQQLSDIDPEDTSAIQELLDREKQTMITKMRKHPEIFSEAEIQAYEESNQLSQKDKFFHLMRQTGSLSSLAPYINEETFTQIAQDFQSSGYTTPESTGDRNRDFVNIVSGISKKVAERYGIPWQALVLHACLESGFNIHARTLFGIKDFGGEGGFNASTTEVINGQTVRVDASFRDFGGNTLVEKTVNSCIGYCEFIHRNPRYRQAIQSYRNGGTPAQYLQLVAQAGYATDPNYFTKLSQIANRYNINIHSRDGGTNYFV